MVRRFDNFLCSVYRFSTEEKRGSLVQKKTLVYENISCDFWNKWNSLTSWQLEVNKTNAEYELNLKPIYEIFENDIVFLQNSNYKVVWVFQNQNSRKKIDNLQIFLQKIQDE